MLKNMHRILLGALLAGTFAVPLAGGLAVAQPVGPNGGPAGRGMMGGGPVGGGMMGGGMMGGAYDTASYLDSLKTRLAITPQQEPAWKDYATAIEGASAQMQGARQTIFEAMGTATWEERRDMMNRMFETRQQAATSVHEAALKLMPALTPQQRDTAKTSLPGLAYGGYRGGMMSR